MMDATFNQRRALFNMWTALHEKDKLKTVHKLTFEQASIEIDKAKKQIEVKGFPNHNLTGGENTHTETDGQ